MQAEITWTQNRFIRRIVTPWTMLIVLPLLAMLLSLFIGRYSASPATVVSVFLSKIMPWVDFEIPSTAEVALIWVRLPRLILATLVGMSLAISGASFQGVFRNPLVSSHILGVASGASLGAGIAIIMDAPLWVIQLSAFCSGLLAVAMAYFIGRIFGQTGTLTIVLAGIIIGSLFGAMLSILKYGADPETKLPEITFWLMGSLAASNWSRVTMAVPPMIAGIVGLLLLRWKINVLSLGDEEAKAMGVNTNILRAVIIVCCTVVTAAAVCVSGVIGWVGLVIPHIGRMLVGPDHKDLLPASLALGGTYLLLVDDLARTIASSEIPIGILTALIGTPFFAYILKRRGAGWA
jgi:iron complex transport system permease protein